jgi:4-aminobutyrate aminotransferase/(S)-3-amino-2-methylpropionate transaminase
LNTNLFSLEQQTIPNIQSKYRQILTSLPAPGSIPILESLQRNEPRAMLCQPPVVWDRAKNFQIFDASGNIWLDWTSGVLVANVGHSHPKVKQAIIEAVQNDLLHTFAFPSKSRENLVSALRAKSPPPLDKVYLFTTGSETVECAIKLARTYGQTLGPQKTSIVSFQNAFHGRTLGAQMSGGIPNLKAWVKEPVGGFYQAPFPDGFRVPHYSFSDFLDSLRDFGLNPDRIAAVMLESYQGGGASFAPTQFVKELRAWCDANQIQLIFDEVQSAFGRTGKYFAFEHYGVVPDLICCGKGLSGSLPISAVIGRSAVMDLQEPGEMTSTHAGNPVCCAAAMASLQVIEEENLVGRAEALGEILHRYLNRLKAENEVIGAVHGKGLVAGLHIVDTLTGAPDGDTAAELVYQCFIRGLLLFAPLGFGGATIKICPPLTTSEDALTEALEVFEEALAAITQTQPISSH